MNTLKTISGRQIKVPFNQSKRTATIKTDSAKYRTFQMPKDEFRSAQHWTGNDWQQFLKTNEYYPVK